MLTASYYLFIYYYYTNFRGVASNWSKVTRQVDGRSAWCQSRYSVSTGPDCLPVTLPFVTMCQENSKHKCDAATTSLPPSTDPSAKGKAVTDKNRHLTFKLSSSSDHVFYEYCRGRCVLWNCQEVRSPITEDVSAPRLPLRTACFPRLLQYRISRPHWEMGYCIFDSWFSSLEHRGPKRTSNSNLHLSLLYNKREFVQEVLREEDVRA